MNVYCVLLANQDTELTQNHSGRKAASRNSWGPCVAGHPVQRGMDANLGSFDRVYESWPLPVVTEVMEPSDGDGAGVRVFQGVTTRTDPSRTEGLHPGKAQ